MCDEKIIRVGMDVPNFEFNTFDPKSNQFGKFSIEEAKKAGKWTILYFYPADFTFVCPTELADVASKYEEIEKQDAEIVSISTDTEFVHLAWKEAELLLKNVKYPMGADPTGKVSKLFGVYDEATGLALRGTFIINPEGSLVSSEVSFYNVGRNADELLRKVKAAVYVRENPNEVCPAKWDTGEKTLAPSEAMVGKVYDSVK
ncbi:MAG: redoxin domain-containing protein [bacterium]|nr:redoxin domain-containing protein [bacterium]